MTKISSLENKVKRIVFYAVIALNLFLINVLIADEYSGPFQKSKSFFAKIVKDYKLLTVFKKNYKLDFGQGPECNSALDFYPFEVSAVVFSLQRQEIDFIAKWKHCLKIN